MKLLRIIALVGLALSTLASPAPAAEFYLQGGERIVFFGDSITQSGEYVDNVEVFLRTRFPDKTFEVINHGIASETISGTSEADHHPRRPDAQKRFERDVAAWKPTVVVACFGMNDGNYFPFDPVRFEAYQAGVRRLIDRTRDEAHSKLVLLTPPPFDPYRRVPSDPQAKEYGYKFPALDYDQTLERYGEWLLTQASPDRPVADVHGALNKHLRERRKELVSFTLAGDAVHPDPTGHWLMAQTLLETWHAPADAGSVSIDAQGKRVLAGAATDLKIDGPALSFAWLAPLPMPYDPAWSRASLELERVGERLNRYRLTVSGLDADRYKVLVDGAEQGTATREELARGLDLTQYAKFPTVAAAAELRKAVQARNRLIYTAWRQKIASNEPGSASAADETPAVRELTERIGQLSQPQRLSLRIVPTTVASER